ncbi:MAG: ATP-binding protein, partial [Planctomycetota bacterium]
ATRCLLYHTFESFDLALWSSAQVVAACLFVPGWRRARPEGALRLSQSAIVGSFTLVAIGIYLVLAAILATWLGSLEGTPTELAAFLFLLALSFLAAALLSTEVRHKVRTWVRRNLYSGRYDYRALWLEAEDAIPASPDATALADALASLVARTVNALEITVWLTDGKGRALQLAAHRGDLSTTPDDTLAAVRSHLEREDASEPAPAELDEFLRLNRAETSVPLRSGGQFLGVLTVGPDRSGTRHDPETLECLRVLARHTARELLQGKLLEGQLRARESEAFRDFAHGVMHDLKNFASTLNLVAQNARRHGDNPEFRRDAFDSVIDTAEKMRRLCNSLRFFSMDEPEPTADLDLNEIVREVATECGEEDLLTFAPESIATLRLHPDKVASAVRNLIINAREAAGPDGRIRVRTWEQNGSVHLEVEDDGPGVSSELIDSGLFQPFQTTKSDGLGLGLFQTSREMEACGGSIRLVSRPGEGARFELEFPLDGNR